MESEVSVMESEVVESVVESDISTEFNGEHEAMVILKKTVNMLQEQIEFLQEELREKNFFIKILNHRNANDGKQINVFSIVETTASNDSKISNILVDYDTSFYEDPMENDYDDLLYVVPTTNDNDNSDLSSSEDFSESESSSTYLNERYAWQRHSSGVASKIMNKMGYKGQGLGKKENGITEPITIKTTGLGANITLRKKKATKQNPTKRKQLHILSDSMMNSIDNKRVSRNLDVKIDCHGGCTIKCMYSHLTSVYRCKPDYILLHVGTNDCTSKTSCEVLKELVTLKEHIEVILPESKVIISLPTMRSDSNTADVIIRNLNLKLKHLSGNYLFMDNSNINKSHLGKKGLHFNDHGIRKMASNIISLTKRI